VKNYTNKDFKKIDKKRQKAVTKKRKKNRLEKKIIKK